MHVVQGVIDGGDHLLCADVAAFRYQHLRIDRAEIRWRCHHDLVGPEGEDRRCALCDVWHDDDELGAGCLGHPGKADSDLAIAAGGAEQQVEFLAVVGAVQQLSEQRDAVRVDEIDHDRQAAVMVLLIGAN